MAVHSSLQAGTVPAAGKFRKFICQRYNIIQLFGYEGANIALIVQQGTAPDKTAIPETLASVAFMIASLLICCFNPQSRATFLMWGGIWLAIGGAMLIAAGYPLTGGAVVLASLETARGGLLVIGAAPALSWPTKFARFAIGFYARLIARFVRSHTPIGTMLNTRPFLILRLIDSDSFLGFPAGRDRDSSWKTAEIFHGNSNPTSN